MSIRTKFSNSVSAHIPSNFGARLQNGLRFDPSLRTAWQVVHLDDANPNVEGDPQPDPGSPEPDGPPIDPDVAPPIVQVPPMVAS